MGFCFQASMFLNSLKHQIHTVATKSLKVTTRNHFLSTKQINALWPEKYTSTQGIVRECIAFPRQWNCYNVSSEWPLSGTPETVEYH
jgi:hypothetical protein